MSYDILVFDPAHAPSEREAFLEWWDRQSDWSEPHPYNDPAFTTPKLRAWFFDMIERFPALNGPYAASRDQRRADYCIGYDLIYVAIWFDKQATHERAFELAGKHSLGFFEASSPDGGIWLPGNGTELVLSSKHQEKPPKPITDPRIAALVRSYRPGGAVVFYPARAENPRRRVVVVYISRDLIPAIKPSFSGSLVQLECALTEAGIVYAVVEEDQQRAFARDLHDAFSAARQRLSEK
jgi:hypothetical protein